MPPSLRAPWPTRHSVPYPTSLPMTLSPSLQSFSGFTQSFAPFSPGPPGGWQVPLTPSRLLPLENPPLSSPPSSASLRHEILPSTFYTSKESTTPSPSSLPHHQCCSLPRCSFTLESEQLALYANHPLSTELP